MTTRRYPPALLEPEQAPSIFDRVMGSRFPGLAGTAAVAVQAWSLSVLSVVLPVLVVAMATAGDDSPRSWAPGQGGLRLWLLGHGLPLTVSGVQVTLAPLGVTALAIYTLYFFARRSGVPTRAGLGVGAVTYAFLAAVTGGLAGVSSVGIAASAIGGLIVGLFGIGLGLVVGPTSELRDLVKHIAGRLPNTVVAGIWAGLIATFALIACGAIVVVVWVVAGRATIGDLVTGLVLDPLSGVLLAFGELMYLPDLVVWAIAWLAGPGFAVGDSTHFTAVHVVAGPMPAVPLLGALPSSPFPGGRYTVLFVVLVGVLAGIYVSRKSSDGRWWQPLVSTGFAAMTTGVVIGLLTSAAAGSIGPGRMQTVGALWWQAGGMVAVWVAVGAVIAVTLMSAGLKNTVSGLFEGTASGRR